MESISERERLRRQRELPRQLSRTIGWWVIRLAPAIALVALVALALLAVGQ